jgi:hypothetical protein
MNTNDSESLGILLFEQHAWFSWILFKTDGFHDGYKILKELASSLDKAMQGFAK